MPRYEYACKSCGEHLEVVQPATDESLTVCPRCGGPLRKVYGSIGIAFKGSGFYRTDSRARAKSGAGKKDGDSHKEGAGTSDGGKPDGGKPEGGKSEGGKREGGGSADGAAAKAGTSSGTSSDAKSGAPSNTKSPSRPS